MIPRVTVEDTVLADTFIPKGAFVIVDIFNIQHSKKVWKDGDEFNPDRFAPKGESSQLVGQGMTWVPFGNGARFVFNVYVYESLSNSILYRQCIGMNFSLNEQRVLLSMMCKFKTICTFNIG